MLQHTSFANDSNGMICQRMNSVGDVPVPFALVEAKSP
jgi:hypothetical protein